MSKRGLAARDFGVGAFMLRLDALVCGPLFEEGGREEKVLESDGLFSLPRLLRYLEGLEEVLAGMALEPT